MVRERFDPYLVLAVSPSATQAEITHAYRSRLRAHHPDTRDTPSARRADEHLRDVLAAYALLRDPAHRADYDGATVRVADSPPVGGIDIPVTYRTTGRSAAQRSAPPLWVGPVRRHRI
ncbi:J domain-containing protein [Mycobacterium sp. ITM-2016-00318]|uniref:J domain-containing protein n=1 Tax=Mycobacterium sp. ITM-2016-00318 TaxID=2099693 RepID=UPI000CF8CA85|nr:J domain-containing protein [Mycobacterium sp. ITM-2016-00318]WNG93719.1 J domain-containing protein [Mycobacterium sp. ITM-2016-00318]